MNDGEARDVRTTMSHDAIRHWRKRKAYTLDTATRAYGREPGRII